MWKRVVLDAAGNRPTCNATGHFTERTYMGCGCPSDRPLWLMLSNKTGDGIAHRMCANQADCHDGKRLVECSHVHCHTKQTEVDGELRERVVVHHDRNEMHGGGHVCMRVGHDRVSDDCKCFCHTKPSSPSDFQHPCAQQCSDNGLCLAADDMNKFSECMLQPTQQPSPAPQVQPPAAHHMGGAVPATACAGPGGHWDADYNQGRVGLSRDACHEACLADGACVGTSQTQTLTDRVCVLCTTDKLRTGGDYGAWTWTPV